MHLYINTTSSEYIIIALHLKDRVIAKRQIKVSKNQAEKLIPAIDKLLQAKQVKLSALKKIVVACQGGSFTSLRIGVITANALAYGLDIPVEAESGPLLGNLKKFGRHCLVEPIYDRAPNIGLSKKQII
jgi:tRNA threonylcarbamoyl adenosine modification protein YeaZ